MRIRTTIGRTTIGLLTGLALAFGGPAAHAALTIDAAVGGAPTGVNYATFDDLSLGNAGGSSGGLTVSFSGTGQVVTGAASGLYAAPVLSSGNGAPFGIAADGADTTYYLSTGIGTVTLLLPDHMRYFGLLWGSVDNYNSLEFWDGTTHVGTLTGTDVWAGANGDQGADGTFYVNVKSDLAFDRVVARSTGYAFELDNVAYNTTSPIPEPATLALFGTILFSLGLARRRFLLPTQS
jgi:hypothetical protein